MTQTRDFSDRSLDRLKIILETKGYFTNVSCFSATVRIQKEIALEEVAV